MLIAQNGLTNKRQIVILDQRHAQLLLDMEPFLLGLGLGIEIRCYKCQRAGKSAKDTVVKGGYDRDTGEFTMTCGCTDRKYIGRDLIWPKEPKWTPLGRDRIMIQRTVPLNLWHVAQFDDIDRVLALLKMRYAVNCLQCYQDGRDNTIAGAQEAELTLTCQCAKRNYSPHAAPASVH